VSAVRNQLAKKPATKSEKIVITGKFDESEFEKFLKKAVRIKEGRTKAILEFTKLEWIEPIVISLLYEAIREMHDRGVETAIRICDNGNALGFLTSTNFFSEVKSLGVALDRPYLTNHYFEPKSLLVPVPTLDQLHPVMQAFHRSPGLVEFLKSSQNPSVIGIEDLRDVLLKELVDNAFVHGGGKRVRFFVQWPSSQDGFFDLVVSDSGPGLISKLRTIIPSAYRTPYQHSAKESAEQAYSAKVIAYAMEYSSTSDVNERRKRIDEIYRQPADVAVDLIPTGLFYVANLCKTFGATLSLRCQSAFVEIDFGKEGPPTIAHLGSSTTVPLAEISGTHVAIRIPARRKVATPVPKKLASLIPISHAQVDRQVDAISIASLRKKVSTWPEWVQACEDRISQAFIALSDRGGSFLMLCADEAELDTKAFSILIQSLGLIDRRGCGLVLFGIEENIFGAIEQYWHKLQEHINQRSRTAAQRPMGFVLVGSDLTLRTIFGCDDLEASTRLGRSPSDLFGESVESPKKFTGDLLQLVFAAQKKLLLEALKTPPVFLSDDTGGTAYYIEGKYYTKQYFQVGRLLSEDLVPGVLRWIRQYLLRFTAEHKVTHIFVASQSLSSLADNERRRLELPLVKIVNQAGTHLLTVLASKNESNHPTKVAILTDVVGTADSVLKVIQPALSRIERIVLLTFVDARPKHESHALRVGSGAAQKQVVLHSICRHPLENFSRQPGGVKVLSIDPYTRFPIFNDEQRKSSDGKHSAYTFISHAAAQGALYEGHIVNDPRHFGVFFDLNRLIAGATGDQSIEHWLDDTRRQSKVFSDTDSNLGMIKLVMLDPPAAWKSRITTYGVRNGLAIETFMDENLAPPAYPPFAASRAIYWWILPVLSTGDSLERIADFCTAVGAKSVIVSAFLARAPLSRVKFYESIKKISTFDFSLYVKNTFSTQYSWAPECHLCSAGFRLEELRHRARFNLSLSEHLENIPKSMYAPIRVRYDGERLSVDGDAKPADHGGALKAYFAMLLAQAPRQHDLREEIQKLLDSGEGNTKVLFSAVGENYLSRRFRDYRETSRALLEVAPSI
jgi:hypothetical protein